MHCCWFENLSTYSFSREKICQKFYIIINFSFWDIYIFDKGNICLQLKGTIEDVKVMTTF